MKTTITILLLLIGFNYSSCKKSEVRAGIPSCLNKRIDQFLKGANPGDSIFVWSVSAKDKKYYYVNPLQCCDIMTELYDDQCNLICYPDGGFTGAGSGHCPEGLNIESNRTLLWKGGK